MWEKRRTPEGKLLFQIDRKEKLVEDKKGGWIVAASLVGKKGGVKAARKEGQKKTN